MPKTKVLILRGDAAESLEVMYPYQRLKEEGYEVEIAAPQKKKLRFVVHDFEPGFETYTEKPGYTWDADLSFADVNPDDYVALVIPGGRAPEHIRKPLRLHKNCQTFLRPAQTPGTSLSCCDRADCSGGFGRQKDSRLSCS
jgi:protease I